MTEINLRVSAVIPIYNAARFLPEAIASVRAQERKVSEIIVIDDGSDDGSADVASSLGADIRVFRQEKNAGPAAARNRGIAMSTSDVVAPLDADDLWAPTAIALLLGQLERPPYPSIALGRIKVVGSSLPARPRGEVPDSMEGFALNFGCSAIRRSVFDSVGPLDTALRFGEDTDWFMRARERGVPIALIDAVTLIYRRHGQNMTHDPDHTMQRGLEMLKRSLDRRRSGGKEAGPLTKLAPLALEADLLHDSARIVSSNSPVIRDGPTDE